MSLGNICQNGHEPAILEKLVLQTSDISGDIIEVGVYEGGSAGLIHTHMNKSKKLFLCDTFDGFKEGGDFDPPWIRGVQTWVNSNFPGLADSFKNVSEHFKDNDSVIIIKGLFPESAKNILDDKKFSFAHLDVDIYVPNKNSLEYLYPKMSVGGVIIVHDYLHNGDLRGVKKAVDEFFADKPEQPTIELDSTQAYIIKQ